MRVFFRLLTQLSSRRSISYLAGRVAKAKWSKLFIPYFVKLYEIDADEAERSLDEYRHLNDFFTRRLKDGARPIHPDADVISPVDGIVTGMGQLDPDVNLLVKGKKYRLDEMLQDQKRTERYRGGQFIVLYLSPRDYHRIHAPVDGKLTHSRLIRGSVYPVNRFGLKYIDGVLSRNIRLISYVQHGDTEVAIVKVGAMNVASIQWSDRLTSDQVTKGDELAYFEFGSTVVLFFMPGAMKFRSDLREGDALRMGEPIGQLLDKRRLANG